MKWYISGILLLGSSIFAQAPVIENVRFEQRNNGSLLVDIFYDVTDPDDDLLDIIIQASDDHGETWTLPCVSLTGDVGNGIPPGKDKHAVWDFYADNPDTSGYAYRIRVIAYNNRSGLIITEDLTLTEDLHFFVGGTDYAIKIGSSNITLDLGGHVLSGVSVGGERFSIGVSAGHVEGITIKNGTIEGFDVGLFILYTQNITMENLTIRNLEVEDPAHNIEGVHVGWSEDVVIRDSFFEFPPVLHKTAVGFNDSRDIAINNIEVYGGSVGVDISFPQECNADICPTNTGSIKNSRFIELAPNFGIGIFVECSSGMQIIDNVTSQSMIGISGDAPYLGAVKNLVVEGNSVQGGMKGIGFFGVTESRISNNVVNNFNFGVMMEKSWGCEIDDPYWQCCYSTANVVSDNVVLGNSIDLFHHELAVGNTWSGNLFWSKQGDEIIECNTNIITTAQEPLVTIDSAAAELTADAQLFIVNSSLCDTTGKSCKWEYIYQSASEQNNYRVRFKEGQIIYQDTTDEVGMYNEPLPESWIDSDSAMVIADNMGGKEFRETFEIKSIQMNLFKAGWFAWHVTYVAQDTTFLVDFDASSGTLR